MSKPKILFIAPHLSTGGLPQYLVKKIELLKDSMEIYCIEYSDITGGVFVVQRNRIKEMLDDKHFFTLGEDKRSVLTIINNIKFDYIHMEEIPEYFCDIDIARQVYKSDRTYKIFETSHDNSFNIDNKKFFPDKFIFVSEYQRRMYAPLNIPSVVIEYPIEERIPNKIECQKELGFDPEWKHVIHVGLFTPRKNQEEVIQYARLFKDKKIKFHFIGNQADNFKDYWQPLMKELPNNCIIWGERPDVDKFYQAADLFLFTSKGSIGDIETSPLVIREAISWNIPTLIYNLPTYLGMYDGYENIHYLNENKLVNYGLISDLLGIPEITDEEYVQGYMDRMEEKYNPLVPEPRLLQEFNSPTANGRVYMADMSLNKYQFSFKDMDITIVSTYPNNKLKEKLLVDTVAKLKSLDKTVLIASHYPVPDYIVKKADYYLYDANNLFDPFHTIDRDGPDFWADLGQLRMETTMLTHLSSLSRIFRLSLDFVKTLGFEYFTIIESDSEYDINDLKKLDTEIRYKILGEDKRIFFFKPKITEFSWHDSPVYETYCFGGFIDAFTQIFSFPKTLESWSELYKGRYNCLEYILYQKFHKHEDKIFVIDGTLRGFLPNSKIDLFSAGEVSGVYYNMKDKNKPILLLYNKNSYPLTYKWIVSPIIGENSVTLNGQCYSFRYIDINQYNHNVKIDVYKDDELISSIEETVSKDTIENKKSFKRVFIN
jgi:glycosyltransferase involved in cell wall biosynthesis